ncbi:hypothetical protein M3936_03695 [Sutcliffiella horikoshii]|uniref:hypothetical protein n=1 Tax=Sutcliffiella horikoshii TaxID=79883 RepID=UPI00203D0332|nr:hypothetical protein [Sutcliffiella horikoshii]MCM3616680.1 hypothetical protein [Sutcliffiella horikoshii]
MAKEITVELEGKEVTIKEIGLFDMTLRKDIVDTVKQTAQGVTKSGKANAPVSKTPKSKGQSGDLKKSIRAKYFDLGLSATVVPRKPKGSHRHLVQYGTQTRFNKSGAHRGKMPANPFMNKAEQSHDAIYNQKIRSLVEREHTI